MAGALMANFRNRAADHSDVIVALMIQSKQRKPQFLLVQHDGFSIGTGDHCDLQLAEQGMSRWQSTLHVQGTSVWIEAAEEQGVVNVNHTPYHRRALRDGDRLFFGQTEVIVSIRDAAGSASAAIPAVPKMSEDLSQLSAEELCRRIEQEEVEVQEFDRRRRFGMMALLSAAQELKHTGIMRDRDLAIPTAATAQLSDDKLNDLFTQVRELSESLEEQTKTLSVHESLMAESSSQLADAQRVVSHQLDQLLERLGHEEEKPGEFRASA